jgi:hypothetical protein
MLRRLLGKSMHPRVVVGFALLLPALAASPANTAVYSVDSHILAAGSPVHSASSCFGLDAVIAEPVAGFSSGGQYTIRAGISYVVTSLADDSLFASGFEDCTP